MIGQNKVIRCYLCIYLGIETRWNFPLKQVQSVLTHPECDSFLVFSSVTLILVVLVLAV